MGSPYFKGFLLRLKEIIDVKVLCKYTKIGSSNSSSGRGRNGNQVGVEASAAQQSEVQPQEGLSFLPADMTLRQTLPPALAQHVMERNSDPLASGVLSKGQPLRLRCHHLTGCSSSLLAAHCSHRKLAHRASEEQVGLSVSHSGTPSCR